MSVQHTQAMESFIERPCPTQVGQGLWPPHRPNPELGIPPEVFARWFNDYELRHATGCENAGRSYEEELAEAERKKEEERLRSVRERLAPKFTEPATRNEQAFVDAHIRAIGEFFVGSFRHEYKSYKTHSPNRAKVVDWLLRKGREVGRL